MFLEKLLLKIEPSEITSFFYNFFNLWGGPSLCSPPVPPPNPMWPMWPYSLHFSWICTFTDIWTKYEFSPKTQDTFCCECCKT